MWSRSRLAVLSALCLSLFLALPVQARVHVPSSRKYIKHIQMLHVYSQEYEGKKLKGKKIVEFGFGKRSDFTYYVTNASVRVVIRSEGGKVVYDKTRKVTGKNYVGRLCHLVIRDSQIKSNAYGPEGTATVTATLKDGKKIRCGVGKTRVYDLPTSKKRAMSPQIIPTTGGYDAYRIINDQRYISPDAYQRVGSTQGFAADDKGHLLAFNIASPGAQGRHSHMLTWISQDKAPIYHRFSKDLGHVNDATFYGGRFFVTMTNKRIAFVYGIKVRIHGRKMSLSYKKYHASSGLRSACGGGINSISYCDGKKYKGKPVFVLRRSTRLFRCYLKGNTFHLINTVRLRDIPSSYVRQNVTYYKGRLYLAFAKLDRYGDKKNFFRVGIISYKKVCKGGSKRLRYSAKKHFRNVKGAEVEGAAASNGKLYFSFNGNDLQGRQADFIVSMK